MPAYIYPKDASDVTFNPAMHNITNAAALPQLSRSGNFVRLRPGMVNEQEAIDRFHASLPIDPDAPDPTPPYPPEESIEALLDDLTGATEGDGGIDSIPVPVAPIAAGADDEGIDGIVVEPAATSDDAEDIMSEPEEVAKPPAEEEGQPKIGLNVIKEMCKAHKASFDPARDRPNLSNGGTAANNYRGEGYSLCRTNFGGMDLRAVVFNDCDLSEADFTGCNLEGAMFMGATLTGANFTGAQLRFAILPIYFREQAIFDGEPQLNKASWGK